MKNLAKEYLFTDLDEKTEVEGMFIVVAENKNEAFLKIAPMHIRSDDVFLDSIAAKTVNMSFAESFFLQTDEECNSFNDGGKIIIDKPEFIKRVHDYFAPKEELAREFVDYFYSEGEDDASLLSDQLLIEVWVRDWEIYQVIELDEIKRY